MLGLCRYFLYVNGELKKTGAWIHNAPLIYSVDGFAVGTYNITIIASDGFGNAVSDTVIVTVTSPPPPSSTEPPSTTPPEEQPSEAPAGISGYPLSMIALAVSIAIALIVRRKRFEN